MNSLPRHQPANNVPTHRRRHLTGAVLASGLTLALLAGCGSSDTPTGSGGDETTSSKADAPPTKVKVDPAVGVKLDEQGGGAGAQLCALFSASEIGGVVGAKLDKGEVTAPMDSACTWSQDDERQVSIQIVPADFYSGGSGRTGYQPITRLDPGVDEAYLVTDGPAHQAWARVGERAAVVVNDDSRDPSAAHARELLTAAVTKAFP